MELLEIIFAPNSTVWPIVFLVCFLIIFRHVHRDVHPIIVGMSNGLAKEASVNAPAYAMMIGFGLQGALPVIDAEATRHHFEYVASMARIAVPCIAGSMAFAMKNNFRQPTNPTP